MSELASWLLAQIEADAAAARAATPGPWARDGLSGVEGSVATFHRVGERGRDPKWPVPYAVILTDKQADAVHVARHDPARVLADCEALRVVVALHSGPQYGRDDAHLCVDSMTDDDECETLLALAQPFAGRPGWRDEWGTQ